MNKVFCGFAMLLLLLGACQSKKNESKINTMQPDEIVNVVRTQGGGYNVKFIQKFKHKVAVAEINDIQKMDWDNADAKMQSELFAVSSKYPEQRLIFGITDTEKGNTLYVSERHIPMQGTPNFRDLGGIVNNDGYQVRWGAIYRSGALAELSDIDLEYFKTLKIGTVIDLRTHAEIEQAPDRYPDSSIISVHTMIGNPADITGAAGGKSLATITAQQADEYMQKIYNGFVTSLTDFKPLFDAMLDDGPEKPFLFHCTAGKDRTGISGALILSALNVDREVIMADYLLSNTYNIPYYENNKEQLAAYGFSDDVARVMSSVKREYLQSLFDSIDSQYGSTEKMLEQVFGITPQKRQQLINKYTIHL